MIIILEYAGAGDLKRRIRKMIEREQVFDEGTIWMYFSQICLAIQYMHSLRVMHRDLKPANIFLTRRGVVKVGDLGLSRTLSDQTFKAHSKVGTPLYMSPEVLRGDAYDFSSDLWSLGCILYELGKLKSPFKSEGLNLYSLFQKISKGDYPPLPDDFSQPMIDLVSSLLTLEPDDRPDIDHICDIWF